MDMQMREYLDTPFDRIGSNCVKWDNLEKAFGRGDLTAMWVADMDFRTVPEVRDAMVKRAEHAIYGYTDTKDEDRQAEVDWLKRRHGLDVDPEWILYSPGVVDSIFFCVRSLTAPEDRIMIQTPVYGPFYRAVETFGRTMVKNRLLRDEELGWKMDYEDMERSFREGVKMLILCSPHNPIGRVWKREELEKVVELANRYGVIILADEIHAEFVFDDNRQTRILSLPGTEKAIMLTSATKSFNLAGLRSSSMIIPDPEMRKTLEHEMKLACADSPNIFGSVAQTAAYRYGDAWMDAVIEYIRENRDYAVEYIRENIPEISCRKQDGTYLMWLDFTRLGKPQEELIDMLVNTAHVALNDGTFFGEEGRGWFRMNLATPRCNVVKTLDNIRNAIRSK
ncbi:MAG: putative C-S lyase [Clostridiales bacterium]|nr:putative C-S lyase [Clostridiales bacterium]